MAPDLAGAAERGGTEPAHAVASPYPEFLSRATYQGAEALTAGRIGDAIKLFTEALELAGACAAGVTPLVVSEVLARRSAAQLAAGDPERALEDSLAAVQQSATREALLSAACALSALHDHANALRYYTAWTKRVADGEKPPTGFEGCRASAAAQIFAAEAESAAHGRQLCATLRRLREKELHDALLNSWRQSMTAPDWDAEDHEWRPTFMPHMKLSPLSAGELSKPSLRFLASFASQIAFLDQPKRALRVLRNERLMQAFQLAVQRVAADRDMAVFEAGTGVLPMLCAVAGARSVTAYERSELLAQMARQTISANSDVPGAGDVVVKVTARAMTEEARAADVVVTDLFDHTLLGLRIVPILRNAIAAGAVAPGATIVPRASRVLGMLVELRLGRVRGFDLSAMNIYRWHPVAQPLMLEREPHTKLSAPFSVCDVDYMAACADAAPVDTELEVTITANGIWNAVAVWYEHDLVELSCDVPSAPVAIYYLDEHAVTSGARVSLHVRREDTQLVFRSEPASWRARHACIPTWHYDMLNDESRNAAYERAITRAIKASKASGNQEVMVIDIGAGSGLLSMMAARAGADIVVAVEQSSHMCDVAEKAIAANGLSSQCLVLQRDARRMFATTSEGLRAGRKPDGEAPELERQADILVFEVFDSGLIGEGALHLTVLAKHRLLLPHARIVPASARVFCQPIEYRVARCCGVNVQHLNQYNWRADYEGVNLDANKEQWAALADPVQVFSFDFNDIAANSVPASVSFETRVTRPGVLNAVSLWFELQLDEQETLTTSPDGKGGTWQNAVYFVDELRVSPGDNLLIEASHDTYSINLTARAAPGNDIAPTGVPLYDPLWKQAHDTMAGVNSQIVKSIVQSPVEHRAAALAATAMASRPGDLGMEADAASAFCMRMFS